MKTLFSLGQQLVYKVGGKHCENNSFIIRYGVLFLSMAIVLLQLFSLSESNLFDLFYFRRADLAQALLSVLVSEVKGNVAVGVKTSRFTFKSDKDVEI